MRLLNNENILKNKVDTIEQFKVLDYLKQEFNTNEVMLYLVDRFTIKLIDKNNETACFKYDRQNNNVRFYEKNMKNKEMER